MKQFKTGLVVGKFSPLHLGHELLIQRAMDACDTTFIISYSLPELPGCEAHKREQWLRARFPDAVVLVVDKDVPHNDDDSLIHRRFCASLCMDVLGTTVEAVFTSEDYGDGFALELSQFFTARTGRPHMVRHVNVDQARRAVPVSGTMARSDPHAHRRFLSDVVYASFVDRVCILGGESSGKTTLAAALAERLGTAWVPEYGRELWVAQDGVLSYEDMARIGRTQLQREVEARLQAKRFLFCDTSPLTTLFYSREMFGRADPALEAMADAPYEHFLLCAPDFDFIQDGTRRDVDFRQQQHVWYLDQLSRRELPYVLLTGPLEQRIADAIAQLG